MAHGADYRCGAFGDLRIGQLTFARILMVFETDPHVAAEAHDDRHEGQIVAAQGCGEPNPF